MLLVAVKAEQRGKLVLGSGRSILADLKRFDPLGRAGLRVVDAMGEDLSKSIDSRSDNVLKPMGEPDFLVVIVFGHLIADALIERQEFEDLRFVLCQHTHDLVHLLGDVNDDGRIERARLCEEVAHVSDDGISAEDWRIGADQRNGDEVRGVLDRLPDRSMIRVVVAGAMSQNEVGLKRADLAYDLLAHFQRGQQAAVGKVPRQVFGADHFARASCFFAANGDKRLRIAKVMPRAAVRDRDHSHDTSALAIASRQAAGMEFRIVWMGAQDEQLGRCRAWHASRLPRLVVVESSVAGLLS
jgi:hypothetical protein